MTRKDFELIAAVLKKARANSTAAALEGVTHATVALAYKLSATNPRFDRGRFLRASGLETASEARGTERATPWIKGIGRDDA